MGFEVVDAVGVWLSHCIDVRFRVGFLSLPLPVSLSRFQLSRASTETAEDAGIPLSHSPARARSKLNPQQRRTHGFYGRCVPPHPILGHRIMPSRPECLMPSAQTVYPKYFVCVLVESEAI